MYHKIRLKINEHSFTTGGYLIPNWDGRATGTHGALQACLQGNVIPTPYDVPDAINLHDDHGLRWK